MSGIGGKADVEGVAGLMSAANWNAAGLIMNLVGVILLFRYGMPYRVLATAD
jgi:hypothetical protein